MKIGLNFDGVISDCGELKSLGAKQLYGVEISPDKFKKEIVLEHGWLTSEQYRHIQYQVYAGELGLQMKAVPKMLTIVPRLQIDHEVVVITNRCQESLELAQRWSLLQGLNLNFIGVGRGSKAKAALGCDVFVEDDIDKLKALIGLVPSLCLFGWGYNQHVELGDNIIRVESWQQLHEHITTLAALQ